MNFYDTNAWVGNWPFAPLGHADVSALRKHWKSAGVDGGLVSSLDALWMLNPTDVNSALIAATRRIAGVDPLPILNLLDPAWEEQLDQVLQSKAVKAIRLAPGYGGWKMNDRRAVDAAKHIIARGRQVVLTARLVDERHGHPTVIVKPIAAKAIARWIERVPEMMPLVQGLSRWELEELAKLSDRFLTDLSFTEWKDSIGVAAKSVGYDRIVLGSLTPLHVLQAHVNKIVQSPATLARRKAVAAGNAEKFLS
jgi:hypothetical protein